MAIDDSTNDGIGNVLSALGAGLLTGDRYNWIGPGFTQTMAANNKRMEGQTSRAALKLLLKNAGADDATADTLSTSSDATKNYLAQAEKTKNREGLAAFAAGMPSEDGGAPATGAPAPVSNLGSGAGPASKFDPSSVPSFLQPHIAQASSATGTSSDYLAKTAFIESRFDPNAGSPTGAKGVWQFTRGTGKDYDLIGPNGDQRSDPKASAMAAAQLAADNRDYLKSKLGRDPTDAELYLAHQQGAAGAAGLLRNPNARAGDIVGDQAVRVNGGNPNAPASSFAGKWLDKYNSLGSGSTKPPQLASADPNFVPQNVPGMPPGGAPAGAAPSGAQSPPGMPGAAPRAPGDTRIAAVDPNDPPVMVPGYAGRTWTRAQAEQAKAANADEYPEPNELASAQKSASPASAPVVPSAQTLGTPAEQAQALNVAKQAMPTLQMPAPPPSAGQSTQVAYAKRLKMWADRATLVAPKFGEDGKGLAELAKRKSEEADKILSPDKRDIRQGPDGNFYSFNKQDPSEAPVRVAFPNAGVRMWGSVGSDGNVVEPPPNMPPGTPGHYDAQGTPHVDLTAGTNLGARANQGLDDQIIKTIDETKKKAEGAVGTLKAINRQQEALDSGIVSGWGADWQTKAKSFIAKALDLPDEALTNSEKFDAASTQKQAELAKAVSQAGHTTNMDLQLGKTIAGGNREQTEAAIRAIVQAQRELALDTINGHNQSVDSYGEINKDAATRANWFKVKAPELYVPKAERAASGQNAPKDQPQPREQPAPPPPPPLVIPQTLTEKAASLKNLRAALASPKARNPEIRARLLEAARAGGLSTRDLETPDLVLPNGP